MTQKLVSLVLVLAIVSVVLLLQRQLNTPAVNHAVKSTSIPAAVIDKTSPKQIAVGVTSAVTTNLSQVAAATTPIKPTASAELAHDYHADVNTPTLLPTLDAEQFDFAQLMQGQTTIDAQTVVQVLAHHDFSTLLDRLAAINKSGDTTAYEQQLQDVALAHSDALANFRIACSDALCMAEFQSFDATALEQFIAQFTAGDQSPLKPGGVVFKFPQPNGDNGSSVYRLAFSATSNTNSVAVANE